MVFPPSCRIFFFSKLNWSLRQFQNHVWKTRDWQSKNSISFWRCIPLDEKVPTTFAYYKPRFLKREDPCVTVNNVIAYACFTHREKGLISTGKYTWHQIVLSKQTNISYGKKQSLLGLINRARTCTSELRLWGQSRSRLPKILLLLSIKINLFFCWTSFRRMRLRKIQTCKSNNPTAQKGIQTLRLLIAACFPYVAVWYAPATSLIWLFVVRRILLGILVDILWRKAV
jgi:hypothetical protein